jgi:hypothetical protein
MTEGWPPGEASQDPGAGTGTRGIRRPGRPLCSRVTSVHSGVAARLCCTYASRTRGADMEEERNPGPLVGRAGVAHFADPLDEEPGVRQGVAVGLL